MSLAQKDMVAGPDAMVVGARFPGMAVPVIMPMIMLVIMVVAMSMGMPIGVTVSMRMPCVVVRHRDSLAPYGRKVAKRWNPGPAAKASRLNFYCGARQVKFSARLLSPWPVNRASSG